MNSPSNADAGALAHRLGCDLHTEALFENLGELGCIPGALFGKPLLHVLFYFLGNARRVARGSAVGQPLQAPLSPAVEVASDARWRATGVRGDGLHVRAPVREAQNLGTQAHLGLEIRVLLDLPEPGVFFLCQSDVS